MWTPSVLVLPLLSRAPQAATHFLSSPFVSRKEQFVRLCTKTSWSITQQSVISARPQAALSPWRRGAAAAPRAVQEAEGESEGEGEGEGGAARARSAVL